MKYLLLYMFAPAVVSFVVQSILCCKVKNRILRHGMLIFPLIFTAFGVITLLIQRGNIFSGFNAIKAALWFVSAYCGVIGYGVAWIVVLAVKKRKWKKIGQNSMDL